MLRVLSGLGLLDDTRWAAVARSKEREAADGREEKRKMERRRNLGCGVGADETTRHFFANRQSADGGRAAEG